MKKPYVKRNLYEIKQFVIFVIFLSAIIFIFALFKFKNEEIILFFLTTFLVLISLPQFFLGIKYFFRDKTANIDTLVGIAILTTYFYSVIAVFFIADFKIYFSTTALIVLFMILLKYVKAKTKIRKEEIIKKLENIIPEKVRVIRENQEIFIPKISIKNIDLVVIYPNEIIPVDGVVVEGISSVDESLMSEESLFREKEFDNVVISGTINKYGTLKIRPTRTGNDSTLSQIINLVKKSIEEKPEFQSFESRLSVYIFPVIIVISLLSFLLWFFSIEKSFLFSFTIAISVLILICSPTLGFAAQLPFVISSYLIKKRGIFIKDKRIIETLNNLNAIIFTKTGVVTFGNPRITEIIPNSNLAKQYSKREILKIIASLEQKSTRPLAQTILSLAKNENIYFLECKDFKGRQGFGVEGIVDNKKALLGNQLLMKEHGLDYSNFNKKIEELEIGTRTVLIVAYDNEIIGLIGICDTLKEKAKETIENLKNMNQQIILVSGDTYRTTKAVAAALNIEEVLAQVLPDEKEDEIKKIQMSKKRVALVGNGIGDAPALAQADVGIILGKTSEITKEIADIILLKDNLMEIPWVIKVSKKILRKAKQNIFLAIFCSALCLPIATGLFYFSSEILLTPFIVNFSIILGMILITANSYLLFFDKELTEG
ncbi:MAG: heavy metal translocating P-type ATPase [Candidatus Kuenenbacteria bacterium]